MWLSWSVDQLYQNHRRSFYIDFTLLGFVLFYLNLFYCLILFKTLFSFTCAKYQFKLLQTRPLQVVHLLRLHASTIIGELRSHMLLNVAKTTTTNK